VIRITISNRKGGTGKSLTTYSLSGIYGQRNFRTLLVDLDSQGSLTSGFWGPARAESLPSDLTVAALFDPRANPNNIIHPSGIENISIIPANNALAQYNTPITDGAIRSAYQLAQYLAGVENQYDICLIDTPPNLLLSTTSAMVASDGVIVPLLSEDFAAMGVIHIIGLIDAVRRLANPRLALVGYLLNMYDTRLSLHHAYENVIRSTYPGQVFETRIPNASACKESIAARQPVSICRPRSAAADAFRNLAAEIDDRLGLQFQQVDLLK
jgi:chromosome partitioning protein